MVLLKCTCPLVLNVIYLCVKFEVTSFYTSEVMARTKIRSKNLERAIHLIIK